MPPKYIHLFAEFQSTRLSRASTGSEAFFDITFCISIHKALACLDYEPLRLYVCQKHFNPQGSREPRLIRKFGVFSPQQISIHKALASLDLRGVPGAECPNDFNPQGSREPRRLRIMRKRLSKRFQSTRLSRASTIFDTPHIAEFAISIHKALASLDVIPKPTIIIISDFNPQGSREPRQSLVIPIKHRTRFQSTRLSRAST